MNVFGPGGVGGYLAARLASSAHAEVSVIARGEHLAAIQGEGLRLDSPHGDLRVRLHATEDPAEVGPVDLVLLTTKATDVPRACERLRPLLGPGTAVITLQNGVDSPRQVSRVVDPSSVFPGVAYIFSTVAAPGAIRHTAGPARFVFGATMERQSARAEAIGSFLASAGVDNEVVSDPEVALWTKFSIICATAGVTAPTRLPIDVLRDDEHSRALFEALVRETLDVGRAEGVPLPDDTFEHAMAFISSIGPDAYSSLLYDLVHGKPMELETLHGAVVRIAKEVGIDVPVTRTVYSLLSPWAHRNAAGLPPPPSLATFSA